jgi:glutaminyl-peptide cyclotransferase
LVAPTLLSAYFQIKQYGAQPVASDSKQEAINMTRNKYSSSHHIALCIAALVIAVGITSCNGNAANQKASASTAVPAPAPAASAAQQPSSSACKNAPPQSFSGDCAFEQVAKQVTFGPRPPASDAIHKTQDYIIGQLKGFGCAVDTHDFHASTPIGSVAMKNIVAKIPGASPNIIVLATHYDTNRLGRDYKTLLPNFVGADDAGSSTGVMLEMARVLCGKPQPATIWIAFFDGEESFATWSDTDSVYGSREMAASLANSGDLPRVKAFVLADLVGGKNFHARREDNSTLWLQDIVWNTAARLGHADIFMSERTGPMEDDHLPWKARKIPVVDIIDLDPGEVPYWHTEEDTLDKLSPKSLQIVGDVILASLPEIAKHIK